MSPARPSGGCRLLLAGGLSGCAAWRVGRGVAIACRSGRPAACRVPVGRWCPRRAIDSTLPRMLSAGVGVRCAVLVLVGARCGRCRWRAARACRVAARGSYLPGVVRRSPAFPIQHQPGVLSAVRVSRRDAVPLPTMRAVEIVAGRQRIRHPTKVTEGLRNVRSNRSRKPDPGKKQNPIGPPFQQPGTL